MALQNSVDKLKERPKDERVAVASGIAVSVVIILLVGWAVLFFRKIGSGQQQVQLTGGAQDQFNFTTVKEAQQQLQQNFGNNTDELNQVRSDASQGQDTQQQTVPQTGGTDQFGTPNTGY